MNMTHSRLLIAAQPTIRKYRQRCSGGRRQESDSSCRPAEKFCSIIEPTSDHSLTILYPMNRPMMAGFFICIGCLLSVQKSYTLWLCAARRGALMNGVIK